MDDDDEDQQGFDDAFDEKSDFCPRVVLPLSEHCDDLIVVVGESVVVVIIINHLTKCGGNVFRISLTTFGLVWRREGYRERERDKTHNARGNNNDEKSTKRDQKLFTKTTVVVVLRGETRSKD